MAYRNLIIENPAQISIKNEQLIVSQDTEHSVPIEDISALLLESSRSVITTAALAALAQNDVCLMLCDTKHMPCAVLLPFSQHSRQLDILQKHMALSLPFKKRLWQQVVRAKIQNQAECLSLCGKETQAAALRQMASTVLSGDSGHIEGAAAAVYFRSLFGAGFIRRQDDIQNACLNYGYAILRAFVARQLAAYGFMPCLGIHHCSELNAFNLADDFIEPFRPVVDFFVAGNISEDVLELTQEIKRGIYNLLNLDIRVGNAVYSVAYAIEKAVQSFSACVAGDSTVLSLPQLLDTKQHCYE